MKRVLVKRIGFRSYPFLESVCFYPTSPRVSRINPNIGMKYNDIPHSSSQYNPAALSKASRSVSRLCSVNWTILVFICLILQLRKLTRPARWPVYLSQNATVRSNPWAQPSVLTHVSPVISLGIQYFMAALGLPEERLQPLLNSFRS